MCFLISLTLSSHKTFFDLYSQVYLDRLKTQEDIQGFLVEIFGQKKRMNLDEFKRVNSEISSEMFLAVIILLQNSLPCTENFMRYQKNFEQFAYSDEQNPDVSAPDDNSDADGKKKTIASPLHMGNLSPIASLAKVNGINFQPPS